MPTMWLDSALGFPKFVPMQRTYNWTFLMPFSMGGILGIALYKFCQDVSFSPYNFTDVVKSNAGPFKNNYPGDMDVEDVTVSFVCPVSNVITNFFLSWRNKVVSSYGLYSPSNHYKKTAYILLEDTTRVPISVWRASGLFPKTYPKHMLSYGDENVIKVDVSLSVDKIENYSLVTLLQGLLTSSTPLREAGVLGSFRNLLL